MTSIVFLTKTFAITLILQRVNCQINTCSGKEPIFEEIYKCNSIAALILARGGSKGVPRKNLQQLNGISLLGRTIITLKNSNLFSEIWISTEDKEISDEARKYGALVHLRPMNLAEDTTTSIESTREFLEKHKHIKRFGLFQCTSVFLKISYIREAIKLFDTAECVFSVTKSFKLRWKEDESTGFVRPVNFNPKNRPRRQDWSGELIETGMFYFAGREMVEQNLFQSDKCKTVVVHEEDALEIDSLLDLKIAKSLVFN